MSDENLTHVIPRELRSDFEKVGDRLDSVEVEMAERRGEMRETRIALTGIAATSSTSRRAT